MTLIQLLFRLPLDPTQPSHVLSSLTLTYLPLVSRPRHHTSTRPRDATHVHVWGGEEGSKQSAVNSNQAGRRQLHVSPI